MDQPTLLEIEAIQEKAITALGRDPFEVRAAVGQENARIQRDSEGLLSQAEKALKHKNNGGPVSRDDAYAHLYQSLALNLPEVIFRPEKEFARKILSPELTRFDRISFLQRFVNIESLCHAYFTQALSVEKLPITLSSLPFTQINGVCFHSQAGERVVLLNEALLYSVPRLMEHFLPMACLRTYYDDIDRFGFLSPDAEKLQTAQQGIQALWQKTAGQFYPALVEILNGLLLPFEMTHASGRSYLPHANETWSVKEKLKQAIPGAKPQPSSPQKLNFLATRGFLTMMLGHEFSHFYRDHHQRRMETTNIRSAEECLKSLHMLRDFKKNPTVPIQLLDKPHYLVSQPTESEADADALQCVLWYIEANKLEGQDLHAVLIGALSPYIWMEIIERVEALHKLGHDGSEKLRTTPAHIKDMMFPREHPHPLNRLYEAVNRTDWPEGTTEYRDLILSIWEDMVLSLDMTWCPHVEVIKNGMREIDFVPRSQMDRTPLFEGLSAIGCFDTRSYE